MGTEFGRAINMMKEVYALSNIGVPIRLKRLVDERNEEVIKMAQQQAAQIIEVAKKEAETIKAAAEALSQSDAESSVNSSQRVKELEGEIAELRRQLSTSPKGAKANPLKIKRKTDDAGYNAAVKRIMNKARSGLEPQLIKEPVS